MVVTNDTNNTNTNDTNNTNTNNTNKVLYAGVGKMRWFCGLHSVLRQPSLACALPRWRLEVKVKMAGVNPQAPAIRRYKLVSAYSLPLSDFLH